jgi:uncharacterized protein (UPF0371 family)
MKYFQVKVEFTIEENGKLKKQKINYLVDSMSVTEAEQRMILYLKEQGENEFQIKSAVESSISAVITDI